MAFNILPFNETSGDLLSNAGSQANEFIKNNAIELGLGTATVITGGVLGALAYRKSRSKSSRRRKKSKSRNTRKRSSRGRKLKFGSKAWRKRYSGKKRRKQRKPHTAGKRKDTSHRRIRYTKNNQPYIIQSNGRARFISKRSVSSSRKRKGGKY